MRGIKLIYASPDTDANLLYWGRMSSSDPFLAFEVNGKRSAIVSELEFEHFRAHSAFDQVFLLQEFTESQYLIDLIEAITQRYPGQPLVLPETFPAKWLLQIQEKNIDYVVQSGNFVPERSVKRDDEINEIRDACNTISKAFEQVQSMLADANDVDGKLYLSGDLLTSERVRHEIERICFENGAIAKNTIVSCGKSSACPHMQGTGALRSNEFIVVDIFPRKIISGYYGDMTRTFLKGHPSEMQQAMYNAVLQVHDHAINLVHAGAEASEIHQRNLALFDTMGYTTSDGMGFFHATGHGVGLNIHESPNIGRSNHELRAGEVVTIEPGLYYPDIGGVRIEDVLVVRKDESELLSTFPYDWVL